MPCDRIVINSIEFETAKDHEDVLAAALRELGYTVVQTGKTLSFYKNSVNGTYARGQFSVQAGMRFDVNEVKFQYGKTVVKTAAKKFGWSFTEKAGGKIQIRKRA
jgi:hypothetical protein